MPVATYIAIAISLASSHPTPSAMRALALRSRLRANKTKAMQSCYMPILNFAGNQE
ncbi:MAG: hypothetical protein ACI83P_001072 [Janthinobacterium sp.]|jgi:hypothetical protein